MAREEGVDEEADEGWGWSLSQRKALVVLIGGIVFALAVLAWMNPLYISNRPGEEPITNTLKDRLDPNTASADDLSILPMLGAKRAAEIVAFRGRELERHPNAVVFEKAEDLSRVRGVGITTARNLETYLIFPTTRPTTAPAEHES